MDFGLVLPTEQASSVDPETQLATVERQALYVERAGFDSCWVGEHHFMPHTYFDAFQTLSYLAAVTDDIRLGSGVTLVPLYNPVQLAERTATLDVLASGRYLMGCGIGYRQEEFDVLGIDREERVPRLLDAMALLERLWTEDDVTFDGRTTTLESVSVNPKPVQEGGPTRWLGGGAPAAIERAARVGDAWLPAPAESLADLKAKYSIYDAAIEDAGRRPSVRPLWREVFVAETRSDARSAAGPFLQEKFAALGRTEDYDDLRPGGDFESFAADRFLIGSPDDVIAQLERYVDAFDLNYLLVRTQWKGMSAETAQSSLERFVNDVAPSFD